MPRDLLKFLAKPEKSQAHLKDLSISYLLVLFCCFLFCMGCEAACIRVLSPMRECSCKKRCCSYWSTETRHVQEAWSANSRYLQYHLGLARCAAQWRTRATETSESETQDPEPCGQTSYICSCSWLQLHSWPGKQDTDQYDKKRHANP